MEVTHCQTRSSQKHSISCIDWDEVSNDCAPKVDAIPENAITTNRIMEQFDVSESTALRRLNLLIASGKYATHRFKITRHAYARYLIPKE